MRRSVTYGLYGLVIAGLVGGTTAWATIDKSVTLKVDGQSQAIHTLSGTVKGALADAGYSISPHDIVAPSPDSGVRDGGEIVLRRGRLLDLTVDGQQQQVWVTASTVQQALSELGYAQSSFISVSRFKRLPITPTSIDLRTPKHVTLIHDGRTDQLMTTAASVSQVISEDNVTLSKIDKVSQPKFAPPTDGMTIVVQRVTTGKTVEAQPIPFQTDRQPDPSMPQGETTVLTAGANGSQNVTYAVVYVDGVLAGKTMLTTQVLSNPTTQVEKVGTATPVAAAPAAASVSGGGGGPVIAVSPGSAQDIARQMLAARGMGSDQFSCLVSLWNKESGWRVNAANSSGAYGIPQALPGSKMASAGPDWQTNAATQITWGLGYIQGRYGTPCAAWSHSQANNWY